MPAIISHYLKTKTLPLWMKEYKTLESSWGQITTIPNSCPITGIFQKIKDQPSPIPKQAIIDYLNSSEFRNASEEKQRAAMNFALHSWVSLNKACETGVKGKNFLDLLNSLTEAQRDLITNINFPIEEGFLNVDQFQEILTLCQNVSFIQVPQSLNTEELKLVIEQQKPSCWVIQTGHQTVQTSWLEKNEHGMMNITHHPSLDS